MTDTSDFVQLLEDCTTKKRKVVTIHHETMSDNGSMGEVELQRPQPTRRPPRRMLSDIPEPKTKSGLGGVMFNLVNSIVGAGIVGIPYSFKEAGLVTGMILLILVAWLTDKSLRIIVEAACYHPKLKPVGVQTYEDLMFIPFGHKGSHFIQISMMILAYGAMVAYLLIIKDTVPTIFGFGDSFVEREVVMIVTSFVIILPLSLFRDMASLSFTSCLSVVADIVLVVFIALFAPMAATVAANGGFGVVLADNIINARLFIGLGVISTAMACQHSAFIVNGSLDDKSSERWATVTKVSLALALLLCAVMGTVGFLGFLEDTQGDILNNFDPDTMAANGARGLLAITMFFTYPMESFVARHVLAKLLYNGDYEGEYLDENGVTIQIPKWLGFIGRRERLTIVIYIACLIPALIFRDLGPVLSITGSLGASGVGYIGPGLVYLGVHGDAFLEYCHGLLGAKPKTDPTIELPVAGDAEATMEQPSTPEPYEHVSKPFWWWLGGFPIWYSIASAGSVGMKIRLEQLEEERPGVTMVPPTGEIIGPMTRDYYISMFFIIFGVIAAIVGVVSNIYVQLEGTFFTPRA